MFERTYVGLDVHAQNAVACALDTATGEIVRARMDPDPVVVEAWLQRFDPGLLQVVYEAGPTGFGLARHLRAHGIDCVVAAPSKLLRAPGDRVKTDKRDALGLARILSLGEVIEVRVPTVEQEGLRDLSRARAVAAKDLAHCRQRINALLLRHGRARRSQRHMSARDPLTGRDELHHRRR